MFVIKHDAGKVEELGARLDVSSVQMALGKVYIEIAGIQFNERSQVLAAAGYPRGKFFVELLFDLDEGHNRMLIQLIQKTAGKGVGRREGRKLAGVRFMTPAAFKDAWAIFLMASGSMSVCLYSCGNESKASLFFSREADFGTLQSARPDHAVTLFAWSGGQPRYGAVGNAASVLCGRI